jgi:hypothetical protein
MNMAVFLVVESYSQKFIDVSEVLGFFIIRVLNLLRTMYNLAMRKAITWW